MSDIGNEVSDYARAERVSWIKRTAGKIKRKKKRKREERRSGE